MRNTVVLSDDYMSGRPSAATSFVRTLLCGAPLFSDSKYRSSQKLKSTQFCNDTTILSRFKQDKMGESAQESSRIANNIQKNQSSISVKMYQDGCSGYRSSTKHYFSSNEQKYNEFMVEIDHQLAMKSDFCELDHVQQYYEKLICQLTMSNSTLMRENQKYQIRLKQLRMLLDDHVDYLNNIYFTLFLNGFSAIQFPDGQTVNLAEFQGTKLKLIPRANMLPAEVSSIVTDEDLFASPPHNNNGSSTNISGIKPFSEGMGTKQNTSSPLNNNDQPFRNTLIEKDDDTEEYLKWMNGQATIW